MSGTTDDQYLEWLYSRVASVRNRNPARSYWKLFRLLYSTEFVWLVPNDDNRVEDGRALRKEFIFWTETDEVPDSWMDLGCSVLEMLIALAQRMEFQSDAPSVECFWVLLDNLNLSRFNDERFDRFSEGEIRDILERLIFRTYSFDGEGGLFPLQDPNCDDQRQIEIWDQMAIYLAENNRY